MMLKWLDDRAPTFPILWTIFGIIAARGNVGWLTFAWGIIAGLAWSTWIDHYLERDRPDTSQLEDTVRKLMRRVAKGDMMVTRIMRETDGVRDVDRYTVEIEYPRENQWKGSDTP